jgi:uncharacterized protein
MRVLTMDDVIAAVKGGSVFASGGGGWVDHGLEIGGADARLGSRNWFPWMSCRTMPSL